jgi:hypothetical protein
MPNTTTAKRPRYAQPFEPLYRPNQEFLGRYSDSNNPNAVITIRPDLYLLRSLQNYNDANIGTDGSPPPSIEDAYVFITTTYGWFGNERSPVHGTCIGRYLHCFGWNIGTLTRFGTFIEFANGATWTRIPDDADAVVAQNP